MSFYQYYHFQYYSNVCSCYKFKRCWRGNRKKKSEITEKDHLKRRVTFRCGWDDIGGNRMKLVSYKTESERPGVQPSGDWQEPGKKRKGHWSWDKWFGSKEKREQVWEKTQDSPEERTWAEHLVLMEWPWSEGRVGLSTRGCKSVKWATVCCKGIPFLPPPSDPPSAPQLSPPFPFISAFCPSASFCQNSP